MSENKHTGHSRSGKGYYIALILCAAAVGITSYVYHRSQDTGLKEAVMLQQTQAVPAGTMYPMEDIPVLATQPRKEDPQPETSVQTAPSQPVRKKLKTASPVAGQEIYGYSMETLSYNQTTRDWRVHNGVDIGAEEGTPVCAAADGIVHSVYEDDSMGYTVVIRHEDGYTTQYSSLREDLTVSAGDTVQVGQTIGYAGSTALVETTLGSHVHFCVTCQNRPMDPAEFLALGE